MIRPFAIMLLLIVGSPLAYTPSLRGYGPVSSPHASSQVWTQNPLSFSSSDPLQIFLYVRNNFIFEPYYGYMKGVNGTLSAGGGNDYDQAAVLVYLLRRANIQARYVEGTINLNMSAVENWLGVETRNATLRLLNQASIPFVIQNTGGVTSVQVAHVWVEAYLNGAWVQLDPSFKQYTYRKSMIAFPPNFFVPPMPNATRSGAYSVANIDTGQLMRMVEYYQEKAAQAVQDFGDMHPGASRTIIQVQNYAAPPEVKIENRYDSIPASDQYYVEFTIPSFVPSLNDFTFPHNISARYPTASLSESRVTLFYLPVDDKTLKYIQSFPGLDNLDPHNVEMFPVLRFNSTYRVIGGAMPLGYFMPLQARVLSPVGGNGVRYVSSGSFTPQVGTWNSLIINTGDSYFNDTILQHRIQQLKQAVLAEGPTPVDDVPGAMLDIHGRLYFDLVSQESLLLQEALGVRRAGSKVAIAMTGFKYDWLGSDAAGWHLRHAGPFMDWEVGGWQPPISVNDEPGSELAYTLMERSIESTLEGQVIHILYGTAPVSTLTILEAANEQGVPIFIIDSNNWDTVSPQLSQPSAVITAIRTSVNNGLGIIIPQRPVETAAITLTLAGNKAPPERIGTYVGTAWLIFDPRTMDIPGWRLFKTSMTGSARSSPALGGGDTGVVGTLSDYILGYLWNWLIPPDRDNWDVIISDSDWSWVPPLNKDVLDLIIFDPAFIEAMKKLWNQYWNGDRGDFYNKLLQLLRDWIASIGKEGSSGLAIRQTPSFTLGVGYAPAGVTSVADAYYSALVALLDTTFLMQYSMERSLANMDQAPPADSRPSFGMVLVDEDGRMTGFDPLTAKACLGVNHLYEYTVTASDQTIGLWNLPAGNYVILLTNNANGPLNMALTSYAWEGITYRMQSREVQIPSRSSLEVSLSVSYDSQGMKVSLRTPAPTAFIHLENSDTGIVRGQLLDWKRNGLAGEEARFYYRPSLNFTGWRYIGSKTTSADGSFLLNWNGAPPGESTVMATYKDTFRAFTTVNVPFTVTVSLRDLEGKPLPDGAVRITANNKTFTSTIRGGSVTFQAYPGYNLIEVSPLAKSVLFIPVPTSITVQFDLGVTRTTSSASSATQVVPTLPTALPNSVIVAFVAVAALLITGVILIKKRQTSRRDERS